MHLCIIISAFLYLIHFLSLHKSLVIHILYIFCMMNVVRMWQENIVLWNISGITQGHWVWLYCPQEKVALFKGIQNEIFHLFLSHFNFWPATEYFIMNHLFSFYLGFLSRTFTIHMTAGEGGRYPFSSSLPAPSASQTLRYWPGYYCREFTSSHG